MRTIHKEYTRFFVLEPTKLTSLVEVMGQALTTFSQTAGKQQFEIFMKEDRVEQVNSLQEVLATENSRRRAVKRLLMTCSSGEEEIRVDFDSASRSTLTSPPGVSSSTTPRIQVTIRSDAAGWSEKTLSAVEQQIDRTQFEDLAQRGMLGFILLGFMIVFILLLILPSLSAPSSPSRGNLAEKMWLSDVDAERIAKMLEKESVLTEEETREVTTMQVRNFLNEVGSSKVSTNQTPMWAALFVFVPIVILIGLGLWTAAYCYPRALFLWGDAVGRYESLKQTRSFLWAAIIGTGVTGVLVNLFRAGIVPYLSNL